MISSSRFHWRGLALYAGRTPTGFTVVPDARHPKMWRVQYPDGSLSDLANLTWAKDGAISLAQNGGVNKPRTAPPVCLTRGALH
jgi:hypothetical protein